MEKRYTEAEFQAAVKAKVDEALARKGWRPEDLAAKRAELDRLEESLAVRQAGLDAAEQDPAVEPYDLQEERKKLRLSKAELRLAQVQHDAHVKAAQGVNKQTAAQKLEMKYSLPPGILSDLDDTGIEDLEALARKIAGVEEEEAERILSREERERDLPTRYPSMYEKEKYPRERYPSLAAPPSERRYPSMPEADEAEFEKWGYV